MYFPVDFQVGSLVIQAHPIFETLAFFVGYQYFVYLKRKKLIDPLSPEAEWWIIVGMATGAFLGSRFVAALENPDLFFNPPLWLYYFGGQTILGGIGGGILGVEITKLILKVKRRTGDLFVYPLILGVIIGRVGCFLTGVSDGTTGLPSSLPWALDQGDGILRHPTSLYEILFLGALWMVVKRIQKQQSLQEGDLFSFFTVSYGFFRFFVEFIKPRTELWLGLSSIQIFALMIVLYYITYFIKRYRLFVP